MAFFRGKDSFSSKEVINNSRIEEATAFNYHGWNLSDTISRYMDIKLARFQQLV
jgi:hypothetical protein